MERWLKKSQHKKQLKDWASRCRSEVEANPSCVHLNESEGDLNQSGLPLGQFTIQVAQSHSLLLKRAFQKCAALSIICH